MIARLAFLGLVGLTAHAEAPAPADEARFLAHGQALVHDYLRAKGAEYGVDLRPDESTWTLSRPYPDLIIDAFVMQSPGAFVNAGDLVTAGCRELTVELPARAARARFYVARVRPDGTPDGAEYRLVGTCRTQKDPRPRMFMDPLSTAGRRFNGREFAARAAPLVQTYLSMTGVTQAPDWGSLRVGRGRGWLAEFFASPTDDCRVVEVPVAGRRARAFVSVRVDEPQFLADVPLALQSLFKDPVSLRTYRFAVVKGCRSAEQRQPPAL